MSMSTSLDDLVGGAPTAGADEERVRRIMAEMGAGDVAKAPPAGPSAAMLPPPQRVINEPPIAVSTGQIRMDPGTARAHVIGNSAPTMADFQSMLGSMTPGLAPIHGPAVVAGPVLPPPSKQLTWKQQLMNHLRMPLVVGCIMFFLSLPVVTSTLSRYAAWMYLGSGEISIAGLFVKSLLAAGIFLLYQQVSAQLDK